jgi:hypothetical protein
LNRTQSVPSNGQAHGLFADSIIARLDLSPLLDD